MPAIVAAAAGESLLAAEVAAPMFAADASFIPALGALGELGPMAGMEALGGLGGLLGGGASFAGTGLGAGGLQGGLGSITAAAAPEATAQISSAIANAAPGANQIANQFIPRANQLPVNAFPDFTSAAEQYLKGPQLYGSNISSQLPTYAAESNFGDIVPSAAAQSVPTMADAIEAQRIAEAYKTAQDIGMKPPSSGGLIDAIKSIGSKVGDWWDEKTPTEKIMYGGAGLLGAAKLLGNQPGLKEQTPYSGPLSKFKYDPSQYTPYTPTPPTPYTPVYRDYRNYAGGGPIEAMSNANAVGANTGYPMADINKGAYATPWQTPISRSVLSDSADTGVNPVTGEMTNFAGGGIADLGAYSDGGRMLKGPGDGMSDNIPATIAGKQPARLANEEFVVPADVVSHLGNGSSDAGAKQLYKMMDRVRQARTGKKAQGKQINPNKYLPA